MNERLSPDAERLVNAARSELAPSPRDVDRVRARILAGVAAGAAVTGGGTAAAATGSTGGATVAAGSAATASGIGILKIVVVTVAITGASITGGVIVARRADSAPPKISPPPATRSTRPAATPTPDPAPAPDPDPVSAPDPDLHSAPDPASAPRPRRRDPRAPSLAGEMHLLRSARAALRAGDPRGALQHLDHHGRQFPDSSLAPEAAAVRIEAICAVGDRQTARALADGFQRRWPDSPIARRVSRLCGDDP